MKINIFILCIIYFMLNVSLSAQTPEWQWATNAGGSDVDFGNGIAIDSNDNSYIIGYFEYSASFGSYSVTSYGSTDIFVAKIDTNGNWQWAVNAGGISSDSGYAIAVDSNGNSFVTGYYRDNANFGPYILTSNGVQDIFIAKIDTNGNWQWAASAGGSSDDIARAIAIDNNGNSYITGNFRNTAVIIYIDYFIILIYPLQCIS